MAGSRVSWRFFENLLASFFAGELKRQMRTRSLEAVRKYINAISKVRKAALLAFAMALAASTLVVGLVMFAAGTIWLAAAGSEWPQVTLTVSGGILLLIGGAVATLAFSERRWLEASGAYRLFDDMMNPASSSVGETLAGTVLQAMQKI